MNHTGSSWCIIPNGTIVYRKDYTVHKNEHQFIGPFRIIQHLHGDSYLIHRITKSNRLTGLPEKCNARLLKIAPNMLQKEHQSIKNSLADTETKKIYRGRGRPRKNIPDNPKPIKFQSTSNNNPLRRGRGRPRKTILENPLITLPIVDQPTTRKRGRPRKNITISKII